MLFLIIPYSWADYSKYILNGIHIMDTTKAIHQAKLNSQAAIPREQQASSMNVTKILWSTLNFKSDFITEGVIRTEHFTESQLPGIVPIS